jgi:hypothetical protein
MEMVLVLLVMLVVVGLVVYVVKMDGGADQREAFTAGLDRQLPKLINRKVAIVSLGQPTPDRETVYFKTKRGEDGADVVAENPRIPWEGQDASVVIRAFKDSFGEPTVSSSTTNTKSQKRVIVMHDNDRVTKRVNLPRQWALPPPLMRGVRGLAVVINPATSTFRRKTLVLTVANGRVKAARVV